MSETERPSHRPFDPGRSPHRVKGTAYRGLVDRFDRDLPGGFQSVLDRIDNGRVKDFFCQPFLPSSMYDIHPLIEAGTVGARLAGKAYRSFVREGAAYQADRDMSGVYRVLLRLASPRLVVDRMPRIFLQYIDFGKFTGTLTGDARFEGTVSEIPQAVCPWIQGVLEGFIPVLLQRAGAKDAAVIIRPFESARMEGGVRLMTAQVNISWT